MIDSVVWVTHGGKFGLTLSLSFQCPAVCLLCVKYDMSVRMGLELGSEDKIKIQLSVRIIRNVTQKIQI